MQNLCQSNQFDLSLIVIFINQLVEIKALVKLSDSKCF